MNSFRNISFGILLMLAGCTASNDKASDLNKTEAKNPSASEKQKLISLSLANNVLSANQQIEATYRHQQNQLADSVVITIGQNRIGSIIEPKLNFSVDLNYQKTGRWPLLFTFYMPQGVVDKVEKQLLILSDIAPEPFDIKILKTYPHNPQFYTQGLEFDNGYLYEGTGQWQQSGLYKYKPENGEVLQSINIPDEMFGEGITILNDKVYQLTWRNNTGFVYDKKSFEKISEFHYATEGWGLTNNGTELIMSDGSETLYFMDANQFQEIRRIYVYTPQGPVTNLNELEFVNGLIYANVYTTNSIIAIDPATGKVLKNIDLSVLPTKLKPQKQIDVLNGIAYDKTRNRLLVTGKWWPTLFEIELVSKR